jgi:hypothetical protein
VPKARQSCSPRTTSVNPLSFAFYCRGRLVVVFSLASGRGAAIAGLSEQVMECPGRTRWPLLSVWLRPRRSAAGCGS